MGQRHLRNFVQEHEIIVDSAAVADLLDAFYVDCLYFIGAHVFTIVDYKVSSFLSKPPYLLVKNTSFLDFIQEVPTNQGASFLVVWSSNASRIS
jgi:hypothetical protein